ncbi:MAG: AAA family ATPase [Clostridia bacterium]
MERNAMQKLTSWKESNNRKPLIIKGARQVGKTWLMKEFGKRYYKNYVYFNFDEEQELSSIFEGNKNPHRIIELLGLLSGVKIIAGETLIILDEIQECSHALNSLKYFYEKANEYHIIVAGSLLGTLLAKPKSYPVGMVNLVSMSPLNFDEFLAVIDKPLYEYYLSIKKDSVIEEIFHKKLLEAFDYYLIIGGMPECVNSWANDKDPQSLVTIQKELIEIYENDFAKHNGNVNSGRILMVFRSIVSQLAKENHKFVFGTIKQGARAREFEDAIEWLASAGMVNRIYNVSKAEHPLAAFEVLNNFKLYLFDTGLLKQMAGIENSFILLKSDYQFKGALIENFVLQQMKNQFDVGAHYFAENNLEIDFILQHKGEIIPVEVKSGDVVGGASLKNYIKAKKPATAIRFSRLNYKKDGEITNIPLYLAAKTCELL